MKVKIKKWVFGITFVLAIAGIQFALLAPFFVDFKRKSPEPASWDSALMACTRVVSVLEAQLKKIPESGEPSDFLERAKILNRLSLEACTEEARRKYFLRALSELQVADALRLLNAPLTDVNQRVGFYWKERAEFFRLHQMADREIEIYERLLSIPGRGRDVYALVKKAEVLVRLGRISDAVDIYVQVAEICRSVNHSDCYIAGAQFADLLEENKGNTEIIGRLRRTWSREADFRDLFRFNANAANRIRAALR